MYQRGFVNLVEMLIIGTKSLMWSAEQASDEEEIGKKEILFSLALSVGFVIIFFIALPYFLTSIFGFTEEKNLQHPVAKIIFWQRVR